jgi:hypothetical protein
MGLCEPLDTGSNVGGVTHGEHFLTRATAHNTNDDQSRVQTEKGDAYLMLWFQTGIQWLQRLENLLLQAVCHCPSR